MIKIITLDSATIPGVPNKNGYTYTKENFNEVIQSEFMKQLLNMGNLSLEIGTNKEDIVKPLVDMKNVCGKIHKINEDSFECEITKDYIFNKIKDPVVAMSYIGNIESDKTVTIDKIIHFVILERSECYCR